MSKNNQEHRDSTTDFFLNFISKEKEKPKTEEKHITPQSINDEIDSRGRAFVNGAIKVMNFINSTLDRMLQSGLSLKILSFILATILQLMEVILKMYFQHLIQEIIFNKSL